MSRKPRPMPIDISGPEYVKTGLELAEWRLTHDYTQESLALELGISRTTMISYEQMNEIPRITTFAIATLTFFPEQRRMAGNKVNGGPRPKRQK